MNATVRFFSSVLLVLAACDGPRPERTSPRERVREPKGRASEATPPIPRAPLAALTPRLHWGQEMYLPVASSVFAQDEERPLHLTVTVTVHNTGAEPLVIDRLDYIGTTGDLLEKVVEAPVAVGPLETREYVIRERDIRGGTGASFVLSWQADVPTTAPVVQAIHVSSSGNHSFGFITTAVVLRETKGDAELPDVEAEGDRAAPLGAEP